VDVLIVGAGLSGIGAACHLQEDLPGKRYAILESRGAIGGTWDLFRYPGIRSDSDMFTLGYAFRPWKDSKAIADGAAIRGYIQDPPSSTASTGGSASTTGCSPPTGPRPTPGGPSRHAGATPVRRCA
jgi:phytoene dehydrogenase-like protein